MHRGGDRLERALEVADHLLVDLGGLAEVPGLAGRLGLEIELAEEDLDHALAVLGLAGGVPRPPLRPVGESAIHTLESQLAALGVFGTGAAWPDLAVAAIMAGLAISGGISVVRQALGELRAG